LINDHFKEKDIPQLRVVDRKFKLNPIDKSFRIALFNSERQSMDSIDGI